MGAFEGLNNYLKISGKSLIDYAIEFNYNKSNILILESNVDKFIDDYWPIYKTLDNCNYQSDKRTPFEYGQDLVASWIFEDIFLQKMKECNKFDISLSGTDKNRQILPNKEVSSNSDFSIKTHDGHEIALELVNDYSNYWYKHKKLHLRDEKYFKMKNQKGLLLAISLTSNKLIYTIYDFRTKISAKYIEKHKPFGNKPAYELSINCLNDFSYEKVSEAILEIVQNN